VQGRVEAPLWRPDSERKSIMSSKPTLTAYVAIDPKEGSEKRAQWIEIGAVWSHSDGSGFNLVMPPGISLKGLIVCRRRKEQSAP
jgi:hypothetical protein